MEKCSRFKIVIDIDKVKPGDIENVAKWLKDNKDIICYTDSYPFIESNHIVLLPLRISQIESKKENKSIMFDSFISDIVKSAPSPVVFEDLKYGDYVVFYRDAGTNEVMFKYKDGYSKGDASLSIPAIKSIIAVNKLENDLSACEITFSFDDLNNQIALIIKNNNPSNSFTKHYNYSTDPTKPLSTIMYQMHSLY